MCVCCNVLNVRVHVKFAMERPYLKRRPSSPSPPSTYPHPVPSLLLSTSFPPPHPPSTPPPSLTPRRFRSTTSHGNAAMGPQTHFAKCGGGMWRLELDKKEKAAMKNMYMCKAEGIRLLWFLGAKPTLQIILSFSPLRSWRTELLRPAGGLYIHYTLMSFAKISIKVF